MGSLTDITTNSSTISPLPSRVGLDRSSVRQLLSQASKSDPPTSPGYAFAEELDNIPHQTSSGSGDTFTLTFTFPISGVVITTASIVFDANAGVIEDAVDTAFTSSYPGGWEPGDIAVSDVGVAGLSDGILTLSIEGDVENLPCIITLTPTGWVQDGTITRVVGGQPNRKALEALMTLNAISGTPHKIGDTDTVYTRPESVGQTRPRTGLIRDLGLMVMAQENSEFFWNQLVKFYPQIAK